MPNKTTFIQKHSFILKIYYIIGKYKTQGGDARLVGVRIAVTVQGT